MKDLKDPNGVGGVKQDKDEYGQNLNKMMVMTMMVMTMMTMMMMMIMMMMTDMMMVMMTMVVTTATTRR